MVASILARTTVHYPLPDNALSTETATCTISVADDDSAIIDVRALVADAHVVHRDPDFACALAVRAILREYNRGCQVESRRKVEDILDSAEFVALNRARLEAKDEF